LSSRRRRRRSEPWVHSKADADSGLHEPVLPPQAPLLRSEEMPDVPDASEHDFPARDGARVCVAHLPHACLAEMTELDMLPADVDDGGAELDMLADYIGQDAPDSSDSESLDLPLTLDAGGLPSEIHYSGDVEDPFGQAASERPSSQEGRAGSWSSPMALDTASRVNRGPVDLVRRGYGPKLQGSAPVVFSMEGRQNLKHRGIFRSPRRRPTLDPVPAEHRERRMSSKEGETPGRSIEITGRTLLEQTAQRSEKPGNWSASCPLSGTWPRQGEKQIPIRSFNFEVSDATASEEARRPSLPTPRTPLRGSRVRKAGRPRLGRREVREVRRWTWWSAWTVEARWIGIPARRVA